jgi:hypothetical protein
MSNILSFDKVVIWGYDRNNHTHHYIHWGWYQAFKRLGYDTYWFSNESNPIGFDYNNCLFISEGYVDQNIPIVETSVYIVHVCISPEKYVNRVKRLIDMRYLVDHIKDSNYNYKLDKSKAGKISETLFYEKLYDNGGLTKHHSSPQEMNYEALYTCWATDLFPEEINFEDRFLQRDRKIYWFGSLNPYNNNEMYLFVKECVKSGFEFVMNDPWSSPKSFEFVREMTKKSFMSPDIRSAGDPNQLSSGETGTAHKITGYIACRFFKSISLGHLGITNSKHMYEILEGKAIYNANESQLFYDALENLNNFDLVKQQMEIVKEKHTYEKRVIDILNYIENY